VSAPPHSVSLVDPHTIALEVLFGKFAESQPRDFNEETIDEAEYAEDYGYLSDSDLEDDEDGKAASIPVPNEDKTTLYEEYEERVEKGKVVKIPDMAFVTWVQPMDSFSVG